MYILYHDESEALWVAEEVPDDPLVHDLSESLMECHTQMYPNFFEDPVLEGMFALLRVAIRLNLEARNARS